MTTVHDPARQRALVLRLKRVEGQLRGIQKLIEGNADCEIVAQQMAAARKALDVTTNQYKAGTVAYLNVLSAQTTVLSAENSLIGVRNRRLAAVNTLLKNVAGRWERVDGP